jgi:glycosyltransferase involved in cell wall biosynthesis
MRILFIADGRSPTAVNWIQHFVEAGHEVHLASTFESDPKLKLASLTQLPVAFSSAASKAGVGQTRVSSRVPLNLRTRLRQWFGPLTLRKAAKKLRRIAEEVQPDLVHAMRIPFEGMLAAEARLQAPLLVSVWGNDFTLHAPSSPLMRKATRRTTCRTLALHTDTERDMKLSEKWGFDAEKENIVLPGSGGVRSDIFYPLPEATKPREVMARVQVINPRGMRAYVRNDIFFQAIPLVLRVRPEVRFLCPNMEGKSEAENWVKKLKIENYVQLMPKLSAKAMADSYHASQVMVSPSTHDGTPNSMLEAMATGCFPVLGKIDSLQEWIQDGKNGLLVDLEDPAVLADAIIRALKDSELRASAAKINAEIIAERANYSDVMAKAEAFYEKLLKTA